MISIIAVVGKNRAIGYKNQLLWNLPEDMARFKKITSGSAVVMGDKTFKSMGKPLLNRKNIVLSLDKNFKAFGCEVKNSIEDIIEEYKNIKEEVFIIGGGKIYELFLPYSDKLYLTEINDLPKADTFFPDYSNFKNITLIKEGLDNGYEYRFLEIKK